MSKLTALVIGATGVSGQALVKQLLDDDRFAEVITFSRRKPDFSHPKLTAHLVDFTTPDTWKELVQGDVLFSAMGTTRKQAGSNENQYKVDYIYQYETARTAAENGVKNYVLVSSFGASSSSSIFYSRIKGELEDAVEQLSFSKIRILQPGPITGDRKDKRIMEKISVKTLRFFNAIGLFKKYKPATGDDIAKAMISSLFSAGNRIERIQLDKIFDCEQEDKP